LCNGTREQASAMKEELKNVLDRMGLNLSEEKTHVTHITEGFNFLGYRIIREMGRKGTMAPKVRIPDAALKRFAQSALRADSWHIHPCLRDRLVARLGHRCRV